jgi:tRNA (adenine22-N1)-methyltransferase
MGAVPSSSPRYNNAMSWRIPAEWTEAVGAVEAPRFAALTPRLAVLAQAIELGARVVDIGADHGLLGAALLAEGRARFVYAVDSSPAALAGVRGARAGVVASGRAEVRLGDGLAGLDPRSYDSAVLAGLGARNTLDILARGAADGHAPERVVVQALGGEHHVRAALLAADYGLADEQLVADGRRVFLTLTFERAGGVRSLADDVDLFVGPLLAGRGGPLLGAWLAVQAGWLRGKVASVQHQCDGHARTARRRLAAIEAAIETFEGA